MCFGKEQVKGLMDETAISPVTLVFFSCLFCLRAFCHPIMTVRTLSFSYAAFGT